MSELRKVTIVTMDGAPYGMPDKIAKGFYIVDRNVVILTDFRGKPFAGSGNRKLVKRGENPELIAKALLRERVAGGHHDMDGPIRCGDPRLVAPV